MKYEEFCEKFDALVKRTQPETQVEFENDVKGGRYFARMSDGVTAVMNANGLGIAFQFRSGRQAMKPAWAVFNAG